jgi:cytochrome c553
MFRTIILLSISVILISSCKKEQSNGETIFRTGKNSRGEKVAWNENTNIATGCEDCHGRNGGNFLNKDESIRYKDLSNPKLHKVPYTDALLDRFLEQKLKSDGKKADTPIKTKMDQADKNDLIHFLKMLK